MRPPLTRPMLALALPVSRPRTGPAKAPAASSGSADNTRYIIKNNEGHQNEQEEQSDLHCDLAMAHLERLAADALDEEEGQVTAVEQRHRQQIDNTKFEAQHDHEH